MILIDTSIWVTHFKHRDATVAALLLDGKVAIHSWIIGELAVGTYPDRRAVLRDLEKRPHVVESLQAETLRFIEDNSLFGSGIGYIDAALLAATKLTPGTLLWTRDKRLRSAAERLMIAAGLDS